MAISGMKQLTHTRTGWLAIILLGVMAVFVLRLFQLQIIQHADYIKRAQQSQQRQFTIPATRGKIYMMDGREAVPVVFNQIVYTVIADPQAVREADRPKIVAALREVAGGEVVEGVEEKLHRLTSRYEVLARNLTRHQAEKLQQKAFAGILYQQGSRRSYPEGQLGAHALGFVNAEGKGQYGVEGGLDARLRGRDGLLKTVTDVRNVPLTIGKDNIRIEAKQGENVVLSVDRNVQGFTEEALKAGIEKARATEGSAIVMNPQNGQVLAMANYPSYHPAEYARVADNSVFTNNSTMTPFEPGSVIKTFSMATGIDKGVVTPESTYQNSDCTTVGDRTMCNALRGLNGTLTMQQALNNSLNVGMITMARRLGDGSNITLEARRTLHDYYYNKFGFGQSTGIEVGEAPGIINQPDALGAEVNYANITFGQGLNITMIQSAAAFCSVVNGGNYFKPTLVKGTIDNNNIVSLPEPKPIRQTISEKTSLTMRRMLTQARLMLTKLISEQDRPGYEIGGKTGTSEAIVNGTYTKKETIATYIGYGGANRPDYVIMVRVAAPGKGRDLQGSIHAAPIFTDISNRMIEYMKLAPKG